MAIEKMKSGIAVDFEEIANGIIELARERGEEGIIAHGMLPADLMESAARNFKEKLQSALDQKHAPYFAMFEDLRDIDSDIAEAQRKELSSKISELVRHETKIFTHKLSLAVFENSKMLV